MKKYKSIPGYWFFRNLKYKLPGYSQIKYLKRKYRQRKFNDAEDIFTDHYNKNFWGDSESVSGSGSTLTYTENIRKELPDLIEGLSCNSMLDAPCGDYNWIKLIKWKEDFSYIGGDIVKALIESNSDKFARDKVSFIHLNIIDDTLPDVDLWMCRDCFIHLSNEDVSKALSNFSKSNIDYLLVSNYPQCTVNRNMPTGSGRLYNLLLPPFNLPAPVKTIDDWVEGFPVRNLSLWRKSDFNT